MKGSHSHGAGPDEAAANPNDAPSTRRRVIRDPAAAAWLLDPRTLRHLEPFLSRAATVAEAAAALGEKPNTVLKRVQRAVTVGLLEVAAFEPRRGRPVKRYRTTADVFFVPFEASAAATPEEALAQRERGYERLLRRNVVRARSEALGTWGTRIYRDARGRLQIQMAVQPDANVTTLDPDAPAALSAWRDHLQLDHQDAKALQREMFALLSRYQRKTGPQRYVLHLGLAPVLEEPEDS
ncbi:MAG: hypothetical protein U5K81_10870 [Trueperaceae bacterium]|nr:hypothetical protein [Trueperaceae bacterium]